MYYFLGISFQLALLFVLNVLISIAAAAVWRVLDKRTQNLTARQRTQIIFALRAFPLLLAMVLVFAFAVPSFLLFEPDAPKEKVTFKMAIPALLAVVGIAVAIFRVFGTWRQTRRLTKEWLRHSEPMTIENFPVPVFRLRHHFPVISVVGIFRPQLFIAEQVFENLSEEELAAAIEHESGHLAARDNFKRVFLRLCRDLLVFPLGKNLERAWTENSESAADEYAAQMHDKTALNLAAAIVKVAKIVPLNSSPTLPSGAFFIEKNAVNLSERVRRLLYLGENANTLKGHFFLSHKLFFQFSAVGSLFAIIFLATNRNFLLQIHTFLEKIVGVLQ